MEQNTFKEDLEIQLNGDIWGATTPPEETRILYRVYKSEAVTEAFRRETLAIENTDYERALFWASVQKILCSTLYCHNIGGGHD